MDADKDKGKEPKPTDGSEEEGYKTELLSHASKGSATELKKLIGVCIIWRELLN